MPVLDTRCIYELDNETVDANDIPDSISNDVDESEGDSCLEQVDTKTRHVDKEIEEIHSIMEALTSHMSSHDLNSGPSITNNTQYEFPSLTSAEWRAIVKDDIRAQLQGQ